MIGAGTQRGALIDEPRKARENPPGSGEFHKGQNTAEEHVMPQKLKDIDIEEVSLVNLAANRKKFCILKGETMDKLLEILKAMGIVPTPEEIEKIKRLPAATATSLEAALPNISKYADDMPEAVLEAVKTIAKAAVMSGPEDEGGEADPTIEKVGARLSKATKEELLKLKAALVKASKEAGEIVDLLLADGSEDAKKYAGLDAKALLAKLQKADAAEAAEAAALAKAKDKPAPDPRDEKIEALTARLEKLEKARGTKTGIKGQDTEAEVTEKGDKPLWPSLTIGTPRE